MYVYFIISLQRHKSDSHQFELNETEEKVM